MRIFFAIVVLFLTAGPCISQEHSMSVGLYSGVSLPYTRDEGIAIDPRYRERYNLKASIIGFSYGKDFTGHGYVFSPGLLKLGQNFLVVNDVGGEIGLRKSDLTYLSLPFAFKIHIIDLSFFRVSALLNVTPSLLLQARESISHSDARIRFPSQVYPLLPPDYTIVYDGVLSPAIKDQTLLQKSDFISYQLFAGVGFRSDWDVSADWRIAFDVRLNYGIFDPRTPEKIASVNSYQSLYDLPGDRRDFYAQFTIGAMRYFKWEKSEKQKQKRRSSTKRYKPDLRGVPKPRNAKYKY